MKVLLVPNYSKESAVDGATQLTHWLENEGVEVLWAHDKKLYPDRTVSIDGVNLVVSLGGDGTLLRASGLLDLRRPREPHRDRERRALG